MITMWIFVLCCTRRDLSAIEITGLFEGSDLTCTAIKNICYMEQHFLLTHVFTFYAKIVCTRKSILRTATAFTDIFDVSYIPRASTLKMSWAVHIKAPNNGWKRGMAKQWTK